MPNNFFPKDLEIHCSRSPMQILEEARIQWEEKSEAVLSLEFRDSEGMTEVLIVSVDRTREESIFWTEAAEGFPYPCSIACEEEDRIDCATQSDFRKALEVAMNWSHVKSRAINMAIWIAEVP